jgi:hypothetical protein
MCGRAFDIVIFNANSSLLQNLLWTRITFDYFPIHRNGDSFMFSSDHLLQIPLEKSSLNQGYYERFFIEQKRLGRGHGGCVFLCLHVLNGISLGQFAVKKVPVGNGVVD